MVLKGDILEKHWNEWDRTTAKVDLHLAEKEGRIRISVRLENSEVAKLEAVVEESTVRIDELMVEPEIAVTKSRLLFPKKSRVPGRRRGLGSLLIKALVAHARTRKMTAIEGVIPAEVLKKDRFAMEWYSRRGFIVAKNESEIGGATFKMIL